MDDFEEKLNSILASPEAMGQIMALADSISGKASSSAGETVEVQEETAPANLSSPLSFLSDLDPKLLQKASSLLGEYTRGGDEKTALLNAMRPFLSEERKPRLDKAMQIARIARVIRAALREFGRDGLV